jgi:hypothetical protein
MRGKREAREARERQERQERQERGDLRICVATDVLLAIRVLEITSAGVS